MVVHRCQSHAAADYIRFLKSVFPKSSIISKTILHFLVRIPVILLSNQGAGMILQEIQCNEKMKDFSLKIYCSQNTLTLKGLHFRDNLFHFTLFKITFVFVCPLHLLHNGCIYKCPCENKYSKNYNLLNFHLCEVVISWQNAVFHNGLDFHWISCIQLWLSVSKILSHQNLKLRKK